MAESHVVTALIAKYAELSGRKEACEKESAALWEYMMHIQATLSLFKEGFDITSILPKHQYKRNPALKKGEGIREAYSILRTANEPMTAYELALRILSARGIAEPSKAMVQNLRNSIGTCLKKKEKEGVVVSDGSHPKRWKLG
jgi:hypothetical protein